jgi:hypothetical protein
MLAEIFMMRLEAATRAVRETLPSSSSPFVSFTPGNRSALEDRDPAPKEPTARRVGTPDAICRDRAKCR